MKTFADLFQGKGCILTGEALHMAKTMPYEPTLEQMSTVGVFFFMPRIVDVRVTDSRTDKTENAKKDLGNDFFVFFPYENADGTLPSVMCSTYDEGQVRVSDKPTSVGILSPEDSFLQELLISDRVPDPAQ
jgi:hypothetical protein